MKTLRFLVALALAAGVAVADLKPEKKKPAADLPKGQTYEWQSNAKRPFWYRLPAAIDPADPPALIVMCHGTGLDWKWSFWNYPIHTLKWRPHDIIVSPESETPGRGFMQKKSDRDDVAGIIKLFQKTFPIGKTYLYGHSQGGFFAYYFAGEKPDLVDGVIGHAGNFFKCKTNKKARDTVGIGILHGRADAVVTVDCAFMTDLIYRKAGYQRVRLFVVENLTKQSGHWPLPWHVNKLLEWQDLVSLDNGRTAARVALREIAREKPDMEILFGAARRAGELGGDADTTAALRELADKARAAQVEAVAKYPQLAESKPDYGPWAAHVRWARRAFGPDALAAKLAAKHDKALEKAFKALQNKNKKTFSTGLKALEAGFLGRDHDNLLLHLSRMHEKPGKLVSAKETKRYDELVAARKRADKEGVDAAVALVQPLLDDFRSKHAAWLEPYAPKSN